MKNEISLPDTLVSLGFNLIDSDESEYFGDKFYTYSNNELLIRFASSRSIITIDAGSVFDKGRWFDLALIKALINNEKDLSKITTAKEYRSFLESNFSDIYRMLSSKNYYSTKKQLELLENKRADQMFPGK